MKYLTAAHFVKAWTRAKNLRLSEWDKSIRGYQNPELETLKLKCVPYILLYLVNQK
jgi:hypothetical protein